MRVQAYRVEVTSEMFTQVLTHVICEADSTSQSSMRLPLES